jgi:hypothetical protein
MWVIKMVTAEKWELMMSVPIAVIREVFCKKNYICLCLGDNDTFTCYFKFSNNMHLLLLCYCRCTQRQVF